MEKAAKSDLDPADRLANQHVWHQQAFQKSMRVLCCHAAADDVVGFEYTRCGSVRGEE